MGITAVLISGLIVGGVQLVDGQRDQTGRSGLRTIGERLTTELTTVDRLASTGDKSNLSVRTHHPQTVAGLPYRVRLVTEPGPCGSTPCLHLTTNDPDIETKIAFSSSTTVAPSTASGGSVVVVFNGTHLLVETGGYA
jgi:hypothetical protein